jgi:hypothetical protein
MYDADLMLRIRLAIDPTETPDDDDEGLAQWRGYAQVGGVPPPLWILL